MLLAPSELENGANVWLQMLSQYKIRDVLLSYGVVQQCTKDLASQIPALKVVFISCCCFFIFSCSCFIPDLTSPSSLGSKIISVLVF